MDYVAVVLLEILYMIAFLALTSAGLAVVFEKSDLKIHLPAGCIHTGDCFPIALFSGYRPLGMVGGVIVRICFPACVGG